MQNKIVHTRALAVSNYHVLINDAFCSDQFLRQLVDIKQLIASAQQISHGKDYVVKTSLQIDNTSYEVAIKVFAKQSLLKDIYDKKNKSKAERSYIAAEKLLNHGINTPTPIAILEEWKGNRLSESYYLCLFEPAICLRDALFEIYHQHKDSAKLMELLLLVAPAIKQMHDAGFMHGDLGNQNILLPKNTDGSWASPSFIDLNRYQFFADGVTDKARAIDLARPILPGNYLHFFLQIYAGHQELPGALAKLHQQQRAIFTRHRNSRKFRHPIRYLKNRHKSNDYTYPHNKDYWLWDEKTAQPMIALSKEEKNKERNVSDLLKSSFRALIKLPRIISEYRQLGTTAFTTPIDMKGRIGVAINPKVNHIAIESQLLEKLGNLPVFLRFYRHETPEQWTTTIELIQSLHAHGFSIMVALLQDRVAVVEPQKWKAFLDFIIPKIVTRVDCIEVTHAYNRAKWGIWSLAEWRALFAIAFEYKQQFPNLKITGPACIDFEYVPVISAFAELKKINPTYQFDALSHLLYVDRRGAPENPQGKFSTLEKAQLLKAIARTSSACNDKVIVSEVNWPLENTDVWSPIVCPYVTARWQKRPSGEPVDVYAHYMLRYLAITLCSGYVDQVFWWQLSAKGYGLVDDQNNFHPRPAFIALAFFLNLLGEARYERKLTTHPEDYLLEFSKGNQKYLMAWSTQSELKPLDVPYEQAWNYLGEPINKAELSGSPVYLLLS
jgi:tRNA A-37 threonylcarbamoyl transferase component Bud32